MKKTYSKPKIIIEDFSLFENISIGVGCGLEIHNHYKNSCSYNASGDIDPEEAEIVFPGVDFSNVFYSGVACKTVITDDFMMDCLNGFSNVFSS